MKIANIWIVEVRDALVRRHLANVLVMQTAQRVWLKMGDL